MRDLFYRFFPWQLWYRLFGIRCECGCGTWKAKDGICARQIATIFSSLIDEAWEEWDQQAAHEPFPLGSGSV